MRCLVKKENGWEREHPTNPSKWLWANDGGEAVVVDDATKTYYCARPEMMETYRELWDKESKKGDKRVSSMFVDLDQKLFAGETPVMPNQSAAWCKQEVKLCSEVDVCGGTIVGSCR
jgi:hypothetical protein